jgi:hypothetical protein
VPVRRGEENGRRQIPLPYREMRVLMVILWHRGAEELTSSLAARKAGIVRNENCVHVVTRRLRNRGLIRGTSFRMRNRDGRDCRFTRLELTDDGLRIATSWEYFLRQIGPELRRSLDWQLPEDMAPKRRRPNDFSKATRNPYARRLRAQS